jgi:putative ABC transport system permease protein
MLMVMGRANLGLLGADKLKSTWISVSAVLLVLVLIFYFLNTNLGQAFIATGDNVEMAQSFGINTGRMEVLGLVVSNGVIALSGALISQNDGYADVSKGIGVIVIGLASIIIGEVFFGNVSLFERLFAIVIGSIFYQFLILAVIKLGFNTNYLKLFSAIVLAICLMIPTFKDKFFKGVKLNAE